MRWKPVHLTSMALLIGLAIVLTRVASIRIAIGGVDSIRLGIGSLPIVLSGALFGPGPGFVVGAIADLVGYFINPMGAYMPHFTLTSGLTGFIPGLILWYRRNEVPSMLHLALAVAITQVIVSVGMTPYFLESLFGIPRVATVPPRIISAVADVVIYSVFIQTLMRRLAYGGVLKRLVSIRAGTLQKN